MMIQSDTSESIQVDNEPFWQVCVFPWWNNPPAMRFSLGETMTCKGKSEPDSLWSYSFATTKVVLFASPHACRLDCIIEAQGQASAINPPASVAMLMIISCRLGAACWCCILLHAEGGRIRGSCRHMQAPVGGRGWTRTRHDRARRLVAGSCIDQGLPQIISQGLGEYGRLKRPALSLENPSIIHQMAKKPFSHRLSRVRFSFPQPKNHRPQPR
jgi:hypothetical protein